MLFALLLFAVLQPPVDQPHLFAFEYGDAPPAKFRLWVDGSIVKNYSNAEVRLGKSATPNAQGEYTYTLSAPPFATMGPHTVWVTVFDADLVDRASPSINVIPECKFVQVGK